MKPISDPRFSEASASPHVARLLAQLVDQQGMSADRLCWGLGFSVKDLMRPQARVSHRQSYLFVKRVLARSGDQGLGLTLGGIQSAVSLGMVGLGMQASATLGEALTLGIRFQRAAGAMLDYRLELGEGRAIVVVEPRFYEPEVVPFYVEEAFASALKLVQHLSAQTLKPNQLRLAYPAPAHAARYTDCFGCPVIFEQEVNSMEWDANYLTLKLPTADPAVANDVLHGLEQMHTEANLHSDLLETLHWVIRDNLQSPPTLSELAKKINLGERTLRRRIEAAGLSYQALVDDARRSRALTLLAQPRSRLDDIAQELGFSDLRSFRRAFHRWAGVSPKQARDHLKKLQ